MPLIAARSNERLVIMIVKIEMIVTLMTDRKNRRQKAESEFLLIVLGLNVIDTLWPSSRLNILIVE